MREIKAPEPLRYIEGKSIFLAGTIDMGNSSNWQNIMIKAFADRVYTTFLNPRRPDWDNSWVQSITDANFYQQVDWELRAMEKATHIVMWLEKGSASPISLLELGMHIKSGKLILGCHPEFYRRGNIEVLCERFEVKLHDSLGEVERELRNFI